MLNKQQRKVAFELTGNTIVSASPGTGKTKTLIARAQKKLESMPKYKSLALITYTNAGADEILSRLQADDKEIFIGTIHRFCLEFILRPFGWIYNWSKPRIVTYDELNEFIEINEDIDLGDSPLDELSKIKRLLNGKVDLSVSWENSKSLEYVAELYYDFLNLKGAIDFNEILFKSYKIISENTFVSDSLANKFYEISVDEFQDTNIYQYEIFKAINSKLICTFFLVGDEKQKIYKFAGAIDDAFVNASKDFNTIPEDLDVTYRSTSNIINGYSCLFSPTAGAARGARPSRLSPATRAGDRSGSSCRASSAASADCRPGGRRPAAGPAPRRIARATPAARSAARRRCLAASGARAAARHRAGHPACHASRPPRPAPSSWPPGRARAGRAA